MNPKIYKIKHLLLIGAFLMMVYAVKAQTQTIRIKFNPTENATLKNANITRSSDGISQIGISSVDKLNEHFAVSKMKRVFPYAGKYEKKHKKYGLHLWYEITVDEKTSLTSLTKQYQSLSEISIAETIKPKTWDIGKISQTGEFIKSSLPSGTNDPQYDEQWHYNNTGQTGGTVDADIDLPEAWMLETGSPDVIVSVHDGGIDFDHEDIAGNMWINPNEIAGNNIDDDNNGYVDDVYGYNFADGTSTIDANDHGTHTSGTIAAETNNGIGMSGIAGGSGSDDGVRLMSCETFGTSTNGGFAESYVYAADNGAVISQNSWGYTSAGVYDQAILDAIDYFIAEAGKDENGDQTGPMAGGVVIFAAGNSASDDEWYPGYYDAVIAVAATDHNDEGAYYSNYGDWVDLAAPGSDVQSTYSNDLYGSMTGTSMACPHVSGVAALIVSKFKDDSITPEEVWTRLIQTTDTLTFSGAEGWGSGRLNAFNALVEDDGQAPETITDLSALDVGTITVSLVLTAPADLPDGYSAYSYELRGSESLLTADNFANATLYEAKSPGVPGTADTIIISGLSPGTTYYFAIKSSDFFGNISEMSNVVSISTEAAPEIVISGDPSVNIDMTVDSIASGTFNIGNEGLPDLEFDIFASYTGRTSLATTLLYPGKLVDIVPEENEDESASLSQQANTSLKGSNIQQNFVNTPVDSIIYDNGDNSADGSISVTSDGSPVQWSAASAFEVPDTISGAFTLTHVSSYINASSSTSETTQISIIKGGSTPSEGELLLSQEVQNVDGEGFVTVPLELPLNFVAGDKFWVLYSYAAVSIKLGFDEVSGGNRSGAYLAYLNSSWYDIQDESGWDEYVWNIRAIEATVEGLTFSLESGTVASGTSQDITLTYDASSTTQNGDYNFNVFISSNDPANPVEKIECTATVTGQPTPSIAVSPDTVNTEIDVAENPVKTETLTIYNNGLGEMMFDLTQPVVEQAYSIPAVTGDFPKGSGEPSLERAPKITFNGSSTPVIQLDGSIAYGYDVYPGSDFVSLSTDAPGTYLTSISVSYTAYAGDFGANDDQYMYVVDYDNEVLYLLDIESGTTTTIGTTMSFTDLACDKSNGTMYASYYNSSSSTSQLYTVDLETGTPTLIGEIGSGIIISIACDGDGNLWGLNLDDNLYAINAETGAGTQIGSVGFDANYAQSMAWDPESDIVYMAAFNNTVAEGQLRIVDTETGATELVGAFPDGAEISAFGFAGGGSSDFLTPSPLSGTIPANSSVEISLEMDATNLTNGDHHTSVTIYSNDYDNISVKVPVNLTVSGQVSDIEISSNFLEFGAVFTNSKTTLPLVITNKGIGDLTISEITSGLSLFETDLEEPVVLKLGDSITVDVIFNAQFLGQFNTVLTLVSDDPDEGSVEITVTGTAISPPVIAVAPTEIEVTLEAGDTITQTATISNSGLYPLQYSLPGIAATSILTDQNVVKNDTGFISNLTVPNSKEEADTRAGHPVVLGAGGPDAHGYKWIDSKEDGGPIFSWVDISETGTEILENSNDGALSVDLPFSFEFYGEAKSSVTIGSNGYLTFGSVGTDYTNDQIPSTSTPNDIIAPYWDDLRPSNKSGQVFYEASDNKFVVQYQEVGNYPITSSGTTTFQVILYPSGNIEYVYKDNSLEYNSTATIGIENTDGDTGLQVAFNTVYIEDSMSVLIMPGDIPFDISASPVSGIVQPNGKQEIALFVDASELNGGSYINELTVSSNDPVNPEKTITTTLEVIGHPEISVAPDSIEFDSIFQGFTDVKSFTLENTGSDDLIIDTILSTGTAFSVDTVTSVTISPGEQASFEVQYTAINIGLTEGELQIISNDEFGHDTLPLPVSGYGLVPPKITTTITPEPADFVLNYGEVDSLTLSLANEGGSELEYIVSKPLYSKLDSVALSSGKPELASKDVMDTRTGSPVLQSKGGPDAIGYTWIDSDEGDSVEYDWVEVSSIGTKIDLPDDGSENVSLPFEFPFYSQQFSAVTVASNGFLTFGDDMGTSVGYSNQDIPSEVAPNFLIAPLWDDLNPHNGDGVYMYATPEYVVFQYNEVPKYASSTLATFEVILYPSGNIKFQYKDVEQYGGLESCTIGLENEDGTGALPIVFNAAYLKDELAVMINSPFIIGKVPAGMTAELNLLIETENLIGGDYESTLYIFSNDPETPSDSIPTTLKVIGRPEISLAPDTLLFDEVYYVEGAMDTVTRTLTIYNVGTDTLTIDSMFIESDDMDTSISGDFTLPIILVPGDSVIESVYFTPSAVGTYEALLKIASNDSAVEGYSELLMIGKAIAPPVISVNPTDTLKLELLSYETATTTSTVSNLGSSLLDYSAKVVSISESSEGLLAVSPIHIPLTTPSNVYRSISNSTSLLNIVLPASDVEFSDSITYDPIGSPDNYFGYNGAAGYSSANKFVVTSNTFSLTHVANYYKNEGDSTPVTLEVWLGGSLPTEGTLVATKTFYHPEATSGANCFVELDSAIDFNQGDVFFIAIHYPQDISYPAAFNADVTGIDNVAYWYNINTLQWEYEGDGYVYKTRAYQASSGDTVPIEWLSISPETASIDSGGTQQHQLVARAPQATPGTHRAKVVYTSNDPTAPVIEWPIEISVNAAPEVVSKPADTVYVYEGDSLDITIRAQDADGDSLTFALVNENSFAAIRTATDSAIITLVPTYDDAGEYGFGVRITDEKGESVDVSWVTVVLGTNRSPMAINDIDSKLYFETDGSDEIDLLAYFIDPDNDALSFSAFSSETDAYSVEASGNMLYVTPVEIGTGVVSVTASDYEGLGATVSFNVRVRHTANHAPVLTQSFDNLVLAPDGADTTLDLDNYFTDIDWDTLGYSFSLAGTASVNVAINGSELTLSPWQQGMAVITLYADDNRGGVTATTMGVLVSDSGNELPFLLTGFTDRSYTTLSSAEYINLDNFFSDPDGDALAYVAEVESGEAVRIDLENSILSIDPVSEGDATVAVYASDNHSGIATARFNATVSNTTGIDNLEITQNSLTNFPNPARNVTTFVYELVAQGQVKLELYTSTGGYVDLIVDEKQTAGKHSVEYILDNLPSGVYFYRLVVDGKPIRQRPLTIQ